MLVDVFTTKERIPFRAFLKLKDRLDGVKLALIHLPPYFDPYASYTLLRKTFQEIPFVAFYTPYTGAEKLTSDRMVANLFRLEGKSTIKVEIYENVIQLTEDLEHWDAEDVFILLFIPLGNEEFATHFHFLATKRRKLKICGLVTGAYNENENLFQFPVITNRGLYFNHHIIAVLFKNFRAECYAIIGFQPLGPAFNFITKDPLTIETVDQNSAINFFQKIFQRAGLIPNEKNLMHLPLVLGLKRNSVWHIRHPKKIEKNGVRFWGPLPKKGKFRFGLYIDVGQRVEREAKPIKKRLNTYEFAFAFNCVGKKPFISPLYEFDKFTEYIQIPSAFVGSFGEIYTDERGKVHFLNGSLTVVFLKEG